MTSAGEFRVPEPSTLPARPAPPVPASPVPASTVPARAAAAPVDARVTPPVVVAATALGVVPAPLLVVYAGLFIFRYFLQPGVQPDITGTWGGEGVAGVVAAIAAVAVLVVVGRAVAGRGLVVFVVTQLLVAAGCGYLLSDDSFGGDQVSAAVGVAAVLAVVLVLSPPSRRWFGVTRV